MASDSGNGGGSSSQFLTSGSSALILAFLAIGLFVGGLLVMFAMRRYVVLSRRRAGLWEPAAGAGPWNWEDTTYGMEPLFTITVGRSVQRRQERGFGARPELLDVHAVKAASDSWEDIMPVSVTETGEKTPSVPELSARERHDADGTEAVDAPPASHASSGYLRPFAIGVHDFVTQIRPSRRRASPPSSPSLSPAPSPSLSPPSPPPPAPESSMSAPTGASASYLRVALAIAMPTQQRCTSGVPQYALGISDVKWSGEPAEDLQRGTGDAGTGG